MEKRKLVVKTYFGRRDERTNAERIVARDPETSKVILFDRHDPMTDKLAADQLVEAEIVHETDTFFIARALGVVTSPELGAEERGIAANTHLVGFETTVVEVGVTNRELKEFASMHLPVPGYLMPVLEKFVRKRVHVEVYIA